MCVYARVCVYICRYVCVCVRGEGGRGRRSRREVRGNIRGDGLIVPLMSSSSMKVCVISRCILNKYYECGCVLLTNLKDTLLPQHVDIETSISFKYPFVHINSVHCLNRSQYSSGVASNDGMHLKGEINTKTTKGVFCLVMSKLQSTN